MMPEMKHFVSVKNDDGTRSHIQKSLLLCNLNEFYTQFTSEHEGLRVSISNFTKHVCVCVYHENVKLMLNEINIQHAVKKLSRLCRCYCIF